MLVRWRLQLQHLTVVVCLMLVGCGWRSAIVCDLIDSRLKSQTWLLEWNLMAKDAKMSEEKCENGAVKK